METESKKGASIEDKKKANNDSGKLAKEIEVPDGFNEVSEEEKPVWWNLDEEKVKKWQEGKGEPTILQGELIGRFPRRDDDERFYFRFSLTKPCEVTRGSDEEKEVFEAKAGTIVRVDERTQIEELRRVASDVEHGGRWEIYLLAKEKTKISSGHTPRTMWRFKIGTKCLKRANSKTPF